MADSGDDDDYGCDVDDTAFLEAATQAEKPPTFLPSPRAAKRRKIDQPNGRTANFIPPSHKHSVGRRDPFADSDDEPDSDDALEQFSLPSQDDNVADSKVEKNGVGPCATHHANEKTQNPLPRMSAADVKRRDRIHNPVSNLDLPDVFCTQPSYENSPPWKPRGARWQKPTMNIGIHRPSGLSQTTDRTELGAMKTMALPGRNSISSRRSRSPEKIESSMQVQDTIKPSASDGSIEDYDPVQDLADLPSDAFASSSSSPQKQDTDLVITSETRKPKLAPQVGLRQTTLFGREGVSGEICPSQVNKRYDFIVDRKAEPPTHHKLDPEAIKTWVYPTNLGTIRDYQFNIVSRGLYHNLLVALPTGLGKTFIAATIMLNWFRWTTEAQIVFVAPTKPLVSQQIDACFHIAGIPRSFTTMLTGDVVPAIRAEEWTNKRVFFMTPQTLLNDLKCGFADPKKIVLLVVDEAHRATGNYAYVEVVGLMRRFNQSFRVLALTATPGGDVGAVQKVIDGLDISKIEIRTENSLDIREYVHQRKVEKHVFDNSDEMQMCIELYDKALQSSVNKVAGILKFWSNKPSDLTPHGCNQARRQWYQEAGRQASTAQRNIVNAIIPILGSISQGMELLKYHSIGPFYAKMKEFREENSASKSKTRKDIVEHPSFQKLMGRLQAWTSNQNFVGHPKLDYLQQLILDHFVNAKNDYNSSDHSSAETRIMVFANFRDSAEEIVRVLKNHQPMIRPRVFVGQSHTKNSEGMGQKEQLDAIAKFKAGTYNTLVATCIGEEGLDIGEVDLIICYDSKASPIRMLQRMGRTGRKREGKIVMLQMRDKEERDASKAKDSYEKMQSLIAEGSMFNFHDDVSRRILPREVQPAVDMRIVEIPPENSQAGWLPEPKKGRGKQKRPPKQFHMPDNVITGFVNAGRMDEEIGPKSRAKQTRPNYPSEQILPLAPLETVLLDAHSTRDLESRYQTVFDDNDAPIIGELNLGVHSADQRIAQGTKLLSRHGRVTQSFVKTLQRIHTMDDNRLDAFRRNLHHSDCESDSEDNVVTDAETPLVVTEDMWVDDDPTSPPKPISRAQPAPKPQVPKTPERSKTRGRPRKAGAAVVTSVPRPAAEASQIETPHWRVSGLADEGVESSPPPTDARFRLASQAETIGSDDTIGENEHQDTQAYLFDSELASFVVADNEDIDAPESSLPSLDLSGLGKGTQAVVKSATKPKRPQKAVKIFTSDPTDDDAVVSSDSDDIPIPRGRGAVNDKRHVAPIDAESDSDEDDAIMPRKRVRRIIDDDSEEE